MQENISSSLESETNFWRIFGIDERGKILFSIVWIRQVLGSKELGTNVLELHFVMLANHDQNVFSLD